MLQQATETFDRKITSEASSPATGEKEPIVRYCLKHPCSMLTMVSYYRHGNFGGSLLHSMFFLMCMYCIHHGSRGGEFDGIWSVYRG